jgi:hypothetical protein
VADLTDLKLYLIARPEGTTSYEETRSAVVAAEGVRQARKLMETAEGDQSPDVWKAGNATATLIGSARTKTPQIIHSEYLPG